MIFVTVGVQLPFDRLVSRVDEWAGQNEVEDIFAQVGKTKTLPKNIEYARYLDSGQAEEMFQRSSIIVSHAGMGSLLNALKYKKPIIAMPRLAANNEHRNNHQVATSKWVSNIEGVSIAWDENELFDLLTKLNTLEPGPAINEYASNELIENLQNFFQGHGRPGND